MLPLYYLHPFATKYSNRNVNERTPPITMMVVPTMTMPDSTIIEPATSVIKLRINFIVLYIVMFDCDNISYDKYRLSFLRYG